VRLVLSHCFVQFLGYGTVFHHVIVKWEGSVTTPVYSVWDGKARTQTNVVVGGKCATRI